MSEQASSIRPLELWGGIESSYLRIGNGWFDQLEKAGHYDRSDDWERIGSLGFEPFDIPYCGSMDRETVRVVGISSTRGCRVYEG